ncbi:MAG: type I DNA topoisomerase [Candidatus Colwellbacteria bacterium]|nr:type I DNA topoisomerase [Candidatus Colwellbacteria bacterium]
MKLVIVESPTKAKTISQYLGKEYEVRASVGHIRDLPKSNKKAIDVPGGFIPHYEIVPGKEKVIEELKKAANRASEVVLTTDPDREGEAIAWHISQALDLKEPKRVVVHEITKRAVEEALKHPRGIDENLKRAQEARRVLDRLVGYELSELIWKKVRYGLSAGRVQSPALRILMEREREIRAFVPEDYWVIMGNFKTIRGETLILTCEEKPGEEKEAERILNIAGKGKWKVTEIKQTEARREPRPPFTTSTLQQAASSRMGYSPARTMVLAQKLYEQGLISYMRTDSLNIGAEAMRDIHQQITSEFGKAYLSPHRYATKSKVAQEAHEAIRPTDISKKRAGARNDEAKLYELIWQRTIASQMAAAKILRTKVSANVDAKEAIPKFSATGNIVIFPGWFAADPRSRGEEVELPQVKEGEAITLVDLSSEKKETEPPPRYTEAGLVKELEKRGIGRPSTYAAIIKTIFDRGYVEKAGRALQPTDTGEVVTDFLEKNFGGYISDSFTAEMENELDEIADGKREYVATLKSFYTPFSKEIKAKEKLEKATTLGEADPAFKCPLCGGGMVIKLGRTGKFLSCKRFPECTGALTLEGKVIEGPKETGEICPEDGGKLVEREGRYGKFISCSNYPKCKYIKRDQALDIRHQGTGVKCPKCGKGEMVEKRGRYGVFYSCSNYPECKNAIKAKPTGNICKLCGSLMMEGTKTIPERCSDKACVNHNPHKVGIAK